MATLVGGIFDEYSPLTGECREGAVNTIGALVSMENKIGPGAVLTGTAQNDVYLIDANTTTVREPNGANSVDIAVSSVSYTVGGGIEHLILTGSADLQGAGDANNNVLAGNNGNNTLTGGGGTDYIAGGNGNDLLLGDGAIDFSQLNANPELMLAFGGVMQQVIDGSINGATVKGGAQASSSGDAARAAATTVDSGTDSTAGSEDPALHPDDGGHHGGGNNGGVVIIQIGGHHILPTGDEFTPPPPNNLPPRNGFPDDTLCGGDGNDTLFGGEGNDVLDGGNGDDLIIGYQGNDTMFGGAGNDTLFGILGNDCIDGGAGNDVIFSNGNFDTIVGGAGADMFFFVQSGSGPTSSTILDFETGVDRIGFVASAAVATTQVQIEQVGANTVLHYGNETVTLVGVTLPSDDDTFNIS